MQSDEFIKGTLMKIEEITVVIWLTDAPLDLL